MEAGEVTHHGAIALKAVLHREQENASIQSLLLEEVFAQDKLLKLDFALIAQVVDLNSIFSSLR